MPNAHAPYPPAFKTEAARLVHRGDQSIAAIARDFGRLRSDTAQLGAPGGDRRRDPRRADTGERIELAQLRREVRILKQERDILKKSGSLLRPGARPDPFAVFAFIEVETATIRSRVPVGCSVSRAAATTRGGGDRVGPVRSNLVLTERIRTIMNAAGRVLSGQDRCPAHPCRTARRRRLLLRLAGLRGCHRRKGPRTTRA